MITAAACTGSPQAARAPTQPAPAAAMPAPAPLVLVRGVEQAVPGTDVRVTLVRTVPYEPSIHDERVTVEPVWPEAWLALRQGERRETVAWQARGGWTAWGGRRWKVELRGDDAVLTVEPAAP